MKDLQETRSPFYLSLFLLWLPALRFQIARRISKAGDIFRKKNCGFSARNCSFLLNLHKYFLVVLYLVSSRMSYTMHHLLETSARSCEYNQSSHAILMYTLYSEFFTFFIHTMRAMLKNLYVYVLYTTILFSSFHTPLRHFFTTTKKERKKFEILSHRLSEQSRALHL